MGNICGKTFIRWVVTAGGVASLAIATPVHAQGPPYAFQTVNYPNARTTQPYGINNAGVIVGTFTDQAGVTHGFKYEQGTYTVINFPGSTDNHVLGINQQGQIVGTHSFNGPNGPWHSFLYENGEFEQFDYPDWESDARAINSAGDIVGVYNAGGVLPTHGFTRTGTDTYATLDYPGALYTFLYGINDAGKISGSYINPNDPTFTDRGFVYVNGVFTRVDYPGAQETMVYGLNNLDDVVGAHKQVNGLHGFVVNGNRLRSFDVPGATNTVATGINDLRQIVGIYFSAQCATGCGFLAQPNGGVPRCSQTFNLSYSPNTLTMNFNVTTSQATTWDTYLISQGTTLRLWSIPLGAVTSGPFSVVLNGVVPQGKVIGMSGLSIPGTGLICADYHQVNTSATP